MVNKMALIESIYFKLSCRKFSWKQVILYRDQLETNHLIESSARKKSLCDQLETSHPVEIYLIKSLCREFNYISSCPVERSARNKSPCREFSYVLSHSVEFSRNKLPCKKQITLWRVQLQTNISQ